MKRLRPGQKCTVFSDEELTEIRVTLGWLKAAEQSFQFWNNAADDVYDECSRSEDGGIEQERLREADVVQAVALDEDDLTDNDERRALHNALSASWESAKAGRLRPASAILNRLRQRR